MKNVTVYDTVVPSIFHSGGWTILPAFPVIHQHNVLCSRYPRHFGSSPALKPSSGDQEQISPDFLTCVSNAFRRMHSGECAHGPDLKTLTSPLMLRGSRVPSAL